MSKSIAIFVDLARQFRTVTFTNKDARIDYEKFLANAIGDNHLHRAIAYGVQIEEEATKFRNLLFNLGYETKYKKARIVDGRPDIKQTSWTVGICMDIVRNIRFVDTIILGSNDPELCELIEWIKEQGVKVIIYSMNVNRQLRSLADRYHEIEPEILEIKNEPTEATTQQP